MSNRGQDTPVPQGPRLGRMHLPLRGQGSAMETRAPASGFSSGRQRVTWVSLLRGVPCHLQARRCRRADVPCPRLL